MKFPRLVLLAVVSVCLLAPVVHALDKQPASVYHARRVALAEKLHDGVAVVFGAEESQLDFTPYRQDSDFYYLTGWNEPGAALVIVGEWKPSGQSQAFSAPFAVPPPRKYEEILFLPARDPGMEKYTGPKLGADSSGVTQATGVDAVQPMAELPKVLSGIRATWPWLLHVLWTQPDVAQTQALIDFTKISLGTTLKPPAHDVTKLIQELRVVKDDGEIDLLKKASAASIAAQRVMMKAVKPGVTERAIAGKMTAVWMEEGCERGSYAPVVGSGINSTTLHYSENSRTMEDGDIVVVDAACEYSMYASDITRTVPVNGHFTARQREIYDIVLGAQKAAMDAFVAGKSKINDRDRHDPDSLDTAAYNYINTHGKSLDGKPLGQYWLHGLGHMVGIDVHDPANYPAVLKPGMVFTIEPGVYIPGEKLGVRIECDFLVGKDGKLIDLDADLPHTAEEVEAAMRGK